MTLDEIKAKYKDIISLASTPIKREFYKFSSPSLNYLACGGRGYWGMRSGAIMELVGARSSGKSTAALDLVGNAIRDNKTCLWIAIERWLDNETVGGYAKTMDIDLSKLAVARPKSTEDAFEIGQASIEAGVNLLVIDSIAASVPKDEFDKDYDDNERMGESARLIKRFMQRATMLAYDSNTLVVVLNQIRANMSTMPNAKATKRFGGKPYEHALDVALEFTVTSHTDKERIKTVQVFTDKNRLGGEERIKRDLIIEYGKGFNWRRDVIEHCIEAGIVKQRGAWLEYNGISCNGKDSAVLKLPAAELKHILETGELPSV